MTVIEFITVTAAFVAFFMAGYEIGKHRKK